MLLNYVLVLFLTPVSYRLGVAARKKWMLIALPVAVVYYPFLVEFQKSPLAAFALLSFWAVVQSAAVLYVCLRLEPSAITLLTWRGQQYEQSMFRWIETGALPEGDRISVVIFHFRQGVLYCALAIVSANLLSLLLGCALLNYMNCYVAALIRRSIRKGYALWTGWNPWSIVRVFAFLWLGTVCSIPLLWKLGFQVKPLSYELLLPGIAGVFLDISLKLVLSPSWSRKLRGNLKTNGITT